ncbi:hypothetical protein SK128_021375, partial [Halocaridina rubra]
NFTCLEIVFTFKRRLGYYLFHTYIPTCLIVIMSWISFWIRPEAVPARVTLGVTSLLTLSTQHANSQKSLPPVSYIKAIDVFMSSCTVFVFFSLMEYALVNVLLGDIPEDPDSRIRMRPRTVLQIAGQQDGDSPKLKASECLGTAHSGDFDVSPARSNKSEGATHSPLPPCLATQQRCSTTERRPNGRKILCQAELDSITSPLASPANAMSTREVAAVTSASAVAVAAGGSSSSSSYHAHLPQSPKITTRMVNGPMHLTERQHPSAIKEHHYHSNAMQQFATMQNYGSMQSQQGMHLNLTFGLPPPPPPPPVGSANLSRAKVQ